jgi:hypothetical protein
MAHRLRPIGVFMPGERAGRMPCAARNPAGLHAKITAANPDWDPGDVDAWIAAHGEFDLTGVPIGHCAAPRWDA